MVETTMDVLAEIAAERRRQTEVEGWSPEHDDEHTDGSMADVAAAYAMTMVPLQQVSNHPYRGVSWLPTFWPASWGKQWWKPKDRRRDLIRAAALLVAEIERLDRASRSPA